MALPEDPSIDPELQSEPEFNPEPELEPESDVGSGLDDLGNTDDEQWDEDDEPQVNPDDWSPPSLRAKQLANYDAQLAKGRDTGPLIGYYPDPDMLPEKAREGESLRKYDQLRRTFFPLILDDPRNGAAQATGRPQTPWTVDEIINAMAPIVGKFAYDFGKNRAGYQPDDAKSDGNQAIIVALQKDGGLSPFGSYASKMAFRAILNGSKAGSPLPIPVRSQTHSDRYVSSYNKEIGGTEKTGAGVIPTTTNISGRGQKCPACGGAKDKDGKPVPCGVCDQRGFLVVSDPRAGTKTPQAKIADQELDDTRRSALVKMIPDAGLTERQVEALLIRFGLEGLFHPGIESTNDVKLETAIGRIFGAADMIYKKIEDNKRNVIGTSGYWADAEKQGQTDEFQRIWDDAFGSMTHKPFDPNTPASLQIAVLYQLTADRGPTEKDLAKQELATGKSKGRPAWPPRHVPQENLGRLYKLMLSLYNAFGPGEDLTDVAGAGRPAWKGGGPPIGVWEPNSKMSVQIKIKAAKKRLDELIASGEISPEYDPDRIIPDATKRIDYGIRYQDPRDARKKPTKLESVNIILDWLFELMLEDIARGEITSIEDRDDQAITA